MGEIRRQTGAATGAARFTGAAWISAIWKWLFEYACEDFREKALWQRWRRLQGRGPSTCAPVASSCRTTLRMTNFRLNNERDPGLHGPFGFAQEWLCSTEPARICPS